MNTSKSGVNLSKYQYTYDAAGNQLTKTDNTGTTNYTYDNLNRLSRVTEPAGRITSYIYDNAGNRRSEKVQVGQIITNTMYTYNEQNRLVSTLTSNGDVVRYVYDKNGNLVSKTTGKSALITGQVNGNTGTETNELLGFGVIISRDSENGTGSDNLTLYTYNKFNQLIKAKTKDTTSNYLYNADGYRIEKKTNGITTRYLYESDKVVLETNENNTQKAFQVYGTNLLYRSVKATSGMSAQSYYYLYNAHGDVTGLIDANGTIAATYDYDAFGNMLYQTGNANNNIKYVGYQYDTETGLYYLNARYYDSVTARFITEDSYRGKANDPLSLNLYTYCANNPIMYIDPSGHTLERGDKGEDENNYSMN
ncbi:MAG: repeat-associated core domain protein [Anaerocolumna sp.]|nr:repeat-associated core domain protein [Anaerocolumna sp.]